MDGWTDDRSNPSPPSCLGHIVAGLICHFLFLTSLLQQVYFLRETMKGGKVKKKKKKTMTLTLRVRGRT